MRTMHSLIAEGPYLFACQCGRDFMSQGEFDLHTQPRVVRKDLSTQLGILEFGVQ